MPTGDVETFYANNQWHNRIEGTNFVFGTDSTRGAAVWAGRARARTDATTHVVLGIDGSVEQRHSYSDDSARIDAARAIIMAGFAERPARTGRIP